MVKIANSSDASEVVIDGDEERSSSSMLNLWTKGTEPWVMLGGNRVSGLLNVHLACHPHLKGSNVFN